MIKLQYILIAFCCLFLTTATLNAQSNHDLKLWYNKPAANWNEALPVGNGRLGAMVFGGVANERLQLNEETVWTGKDVDFVNPQSKAALPEVRRLLFAGKYIEAQQLAQEKMMGDKKVGSTYQTLGDLNFEFNLPATNITNYRRELDIDSAIAKISFTSGGINYDREVFSSAPANALYMRLTASKKASINFTLHLSRPGNKASIKAIDNDMLMTEHVGDGVGVRMATRVKVITEGGTVSVVGNSLKVDNADAVTVVLTAATDYRGEDPETISAREMNLAVKKDFATIKQAHISDYQKYFKRVDIHLGAKAVDLPTDERLAAVQAGKMDAQLLALYYQFGRYLLISSSRPGGLPANLQGIWADGLYPPWSADYHININIQMNYWLSEITNLPEMHDPFLQFINALIKDGKKTARNMYGVGGAMAHFTTDAWHFTETYGKTQWAMWPMGLAWSAQHLWEHYLFSEDKKYLAANAYPTLKEAAQFCMEWLVKNPTTNALVSGPSISPENTFKTKTGEVATMVMGPTMDHMIIRDLFTNTIAASTILQKDESFRLQLKKILRQLAPTKIGSDGRIMEWTEEFEEAEPGHRHISHLFGLHPGREITRETPALLAAARKTIDYRLTNGGGHTGWSRAWIINFFARLHDGNAAYENLVALLQKSTLPNLFDNHPPFQIDGNFGATAGITEMLIQSHAGEIELLPALPAAWPTGHVKGLVARGGFEINMNWNEGKLTQVTVLSKLGNKCKIRYGNKLINLNTKKGRKYQVKQLM
ncbi:glycoside hydrolase family 95 protein [Aridibaculum aurantiacum]|uniref:glycoside hydrolase family 95 protein n=1 Tax=Aridibaculum aurantiacum TaxID=2810307 RepID=UPI001A96D2EF|nr:glycoside hydrolase family 95 protein [Aridibaculum aurantiacum]